MMELPTIEKVSVHAVRVGKDVRYVETEALAKDTAYEMALIEALNRWFGIETAKVTDDVQVTVKGVRSALLMNRHELHRICNLLNGGNTVPVTAPPKADAPVLGALPAPSAEASAT